MHAFGLTMTTFSHSNLTWFLCALTNSTFVHHTHLLYFWIRFLLNLTLWNQKTIRKDRKDFWHLFFLRPSFLLYSSTVLQMSAVVLNANVFLTHLTGQTEGIIILCAFSNVDGWWCIFFAFPSCHPFVSHHFFACCLV